MKDHIKRTIQLFEITSTGIDSGGIQLIVGVKGSIMVHVLGGRHVAHAKMQTAGIGFIRHIKLACLKWEL